jgi:fatty-acid desaturase
MEVFFFPWLFIIKPYLTYNYLGGMEAVAWSIAVPMVAGWHSTFLVNSAAHVWGRQPYETGEDNFTTGSATTMAPLGKTSAVS